MRAYEDQPKRAPRRRRRPVVVDIGIALLASGASVVAPLSIAGAGCSSGSTGAQSALDATPMDATTEASGDDAAPIDGALDDADGGLNIPPNRCPSAHGPRMVELPVPGRGTYCIDSTEVTARQYAEFYSAAAGSWPFDAGLAARCYQAYWSEHTYKLDDPRTQQTQGCNYDPVARPDYPMSCVSWCSAQAYCEWAGKRLCGRVQGGELPTGSSNDPAQSEWYRACSERGANMWSYGDAWAPVCNDRWRGDASDVLGDAAPVGAFGKCHPPDEPYAFLRDMNGNVAEWESACDAGDTPSTIGYDICNVRGGSFYAGRFEHIEISSACRTDDDPYLPPIGEAVVHIMTDPTIGFRCCAD